MSYNGENAKIQAKEVTVMATMDDIAKRLGISKGTVSKAFSGASDFKYCDHFTHYSSAIIKS